VSKKRADNSKNLKPWPKGVSGNPNGRPCKLPKLEEIIRKVLGSEDDESSKVYTIIKNMAKRAESQQWAADSLLDRTYGRSKQVIDENSNQPVTWNEIRTYDKQDLPKDVPSTSKTSGKKSVTRTNIKSKSKGKR
jgi:hypothetical protein